MTRLIYWRESLRAKVFEKMSPRCGDIQHRNRSGSGRVRLGRMKMDLRQTKEGSQSEAGGQMREMDEVHEVSGASRLCRSRRQFGFANHR